MDFDDWSSAVTARVNEHNEDLLKAYKMLKSLLLDIESIKLTLANILNSYPPKESKKKTKGKVKCQK